MARHRRQQLLADTLADPGIRAGLVIVVVVLAGFTGVALAWRGIAAKLFVPLQVPFLVSAGLGGTALLMTAAVLLGVHLHRRDEAATRVEVDTIVRASAAVAEAITARRGQRGHRIPTPLVTLGTTLHRAKCRIVSDRPDAQRLSRAEARAAGLRSCRICRPDEP